MCSNACVLTTLNLFKPNSYAKIIGSQSKFRYPDPEGMGEYNDFVLRCQYKLIGCLTKSF